MRIGYIDNLRAILMMLGVVLHSAAVFSVQKYWLVSYQTPSVYLDMLNSSIHSFRMPLFFMIAGFFALMLLKAYRVKRFLRNRLLRIGVPLVAAILVLNTLQNYLLSFYYQDSEVQSNFYTVHAISHLWFLINLLCYCFTLAIAFVCVKGHFTFSSLMSKPLGFYVAIFVFPLFYIAVLAAGTMGVPIYQQLMIIGMPFMLMYYFSFFLFGVLIYGLKSWLIFIEDGLPKWMALGCIIILALQWLPNTESSLHKIVNEYVRVLGVMVLCLFIWSAFARLLNRPRAWLNYLSDASYTMYLIHHLLIVALVVAINTMGIKMPAMLLFGVLVVLVFTLSLLVHHYLVKRFTILKLAFNGK